MCESISLYGVTPWNTLTPIDAPAEVGRGESGPFEWIEDDATSNGQRDLRAAKDGNREDEQS